VCKILTTLFPGSLILPPKASEERPSLALGGKMRHPGNEVDILIAHEKILQKLSQWLPCTFQVLLKCTAAIFFLMDDCS